MRTRLLFFISTLFVLNVFGQMQPTEIQFPASPTVAGLAKYVDTPVNYYSGIPNIGLPIFEINTGDFSLPISLSYHAGGVRIAEEASWVGLGWSLNAGGMITRQIRGEDDIHSGYNHSIRGYLQNYGNYDKIHSIGFFNCTPEMASYNVWSNLRPCGFLPPFNANWELTYLDKVFNPSGIFYKDEFFDQAIGSSTPNKLSDTEPDLFMFNFGGYSGKFILQAADENDATLGEGILLDNSLNLRIKFFNDSINPYFIVTDPNGVVYEFHEVDRSKHSLAPVNYPDQISGWLLTKIITANNKVINLAYQENEQYINTFPQKSETIDYTYSTVSSTTGVAKWMKLGNVTYALNFASPVQGCTAAISPAGMKETVGSHTNTYTHVLDSISWDGGQVNFNTGYREDYGNGNAKKLSDIEIFDADLNPIKKVNLVQDYFNSNATGTNYEKRKYKRLKLLEIEEVNVGNSQETLPPYKFAYYEDEALGAKNTNSYDHWGYYNGKGNPNSTIPEMISFTNERLSSYGGADRRANLEYTVQGNIKTIEYPTGGVVSYQYELNDFYSGAGGTSLYQEKTNSYTVWNYWSHAYPFVAYGGDTNVGLPNYREFEVVDSQNVSSIIFSFEMNKSFYDDIISFPRPFTIDLYKLEGINQTETLIESISLDDFPNMATWPTQEVFRQFEKEFAMSLTTGHYRFRINIPPEYTALTSTSNYYLTAELEYDYTDTSQLALGYTAGGLRIKEITSPKNTRQFLYKTIKTVNSQPQETSSGTLLSNPKYYNAINIGGSFGQCGFAPNTSMMRFTTNSSVPVSGGIQGNIVGYSKVIEAVINTETNESFSNEYNYHVENGTVLPFTPIFSNSMEGKLTHLRKYNSDDKLVESTANHYINYTVDNIQAMNIYHNSFIQDPNNLQLNSRYFIPRDITILLRQEQQIFGTEENDNTVIENITNYDYDIGDHANLDLTTHRNPITSQQVLENGDKQINKTYFPEEMLEYVSGLSQTQQVLMQDLIDVNRVNIPVQTMTYKEIDGVEKLIATNRIEFQKTSNNLIVPKYFKTSIGNSDFVTKVEYTRFDDQGNILEIKNSQTGVYTSYIWSYNKIHLIAKIENAQFTNVANALVINTAALEDFDETNIATLSTLRTHASLSNAIVTTYTYKPLIGVESITDARGRKTTYHYDDYNRLQYVTDHDDKVVSENKYYYKN